MQTHLDRISSCAIEVRTNDISRTLLHAYIACLPPSELCKYAIECLDQSSELCSAIRSRIVRLAQEGFGLTEIDELAQNLMKINSSGQRVRARIEALLSHIYTYLPPPTRQSMLERWYDRGTKGSSARWLRAIADDSFLFDINTVLDYWRHSEDWRAAKLLAYRAEPDMLIAILPELIVQTDKGWIVSRAVLRAGRTSEECWEAIRSKFPGTYVYLCAKCGRGLSEEEALAAVHDAEGGVFGDRGLAIWALGQLAMVSVLDHVWQVRQELYDADFEHLVRD